MQFKPVPEPPSDLAGVAAILEAVPETAGAVGDCCARLVDETALATRDEAEAWLTFLRALELATAEPAGYRRTRSGSQSADGRPLDLEADPDRLRRAFRDRVHRADAVLERLESADGPLSAAAVADELRAARLASERERRPERFDSDPAERVRRLLEWAVLLDLAEPTADGDRYRPSPDLE